MIKELIKDLVYDNITLSQALTRAKLIAYKIDNNDYRLWIENELNGYSDHNALPQYRKIPCELKAVISNPFYGTYEIPFVIDSPIFYNIDVTQSISQLEENLSAANGKLSGYQKLPQNLVQELRKTTDEGQQLTEVRRTINFSQYSHILNLTKQKLIDTLLKLDNEFPNLINDYAMTKENSEKVQNIVTNNIYGNNNNVATGKNAEINTTHTVIKIEESINKIKDAVTQSQELNNIIKEEVLEQLTEILEQAKLSEENRNKKSVLKAIFNGVGTTLNSVGNLAEIWGTWSIPISSFFNF